MWEPCWKHGFSLPIATRSITYLAFDVTQFAVEEYPVYHSLYDNYVWVERFGDPLFHRHVAGTEPSIFKESFQVYPKCMQINFPCIIIQWPAFGVWLHWNLLATRSYPSITSLMRPSWRYHLFTFDVHNSLLVYWYTCVYESWDMKELCHLVDCRSAQKIS